MPIIYARHVQEVGGTGAAQIALSVPPKLYTPQGPKWLARYTGADPESQRFRHKSHTEAKEVLMRYMGKVDEYIFSQWVGGNSTREERWNVATAQMSKEDYENLLENLRRVPNLHVNPDINMLEYQKSHLDHLILQLILLSRNGSTQNQPNDSV